MNKIVVSFLFMLVCSFDGLSQDKTFQEQISGARTNLKTYIDPDNSLQQFYALKDTGIFMYASAQDKLKNKHEFFLHWNEASDFSKLFNDHSFDSIQVIYNKGRIPSGLTMNVKPEDSPIPLPLSHLLKGKKIALDPGHIAGDSIMARIEGKCLFLTDESQGQKEYLRIIEGELTLATAHMVKQQLEAMGAEVMMTRSKGNETAFGISYQDWLKNEMPEVQLARSGKIFHDKFKSMELLERAKKINEFRPDATLIIHYNVDETNTGWTKPGQKNFTMAFIGGNIKSKNLNGKRNRIELLRMIATDHLPQSERLAGILVSNFSEKLGIPPAQMNDALYLKEESLKTPSKGVFSRNLALTRLVHGPVAYGESLYQDNFKECRELCKCTIDVMGVKTSERVKIVADCYVKAIVDFFGKN